MLTFIILCFMVATILFATSLFFNIFKVLFKISIIAGAITLFILFLSWIS